MSKLKISEEELDALEKQEEKNEKIQQKKAPNTTPLSKLVLLVIIAYAANITLIVLTAQELNESKVTSYNPDDGLPGAVNIMNDSNQVAAITVSSMLEMKEEADHIITLNLTPIPSLDPNIINAGTLESGFVLNPGVSRKHEFRVLKRGNRVSLKIDDDGSVLVFPADVNGLKSSPMGEGAFIDAPSTPPVPGATINYTMRRLYGIAPIEITPSFDETYVLIEDGTARRFGQSNSNNNVIALGNSRVYIDENDEQSNHVFTRDARIYIQNVRVDTLSRKVFVQKHAPPTQQQQEQSTSSTASTPPSITLVHDQTTNQRFIEVAV